MSPALNGSTALQRFEHSNAVEIRNGIMFDFYPGLPHMHVHVITASFPGSFPATLYSYCTKNSVGEESGNEATCTYILFDG